MITTRKVGAVVLALVLGACSSGRMVQVPPRLDLGELGTVGLIDISTPTEADDLRTRANRQFLTAIQAAQPGVPVLELGDETRVLGDVERASLSPETVREIGETKHVDVILHGVLETKEVRPKFSLASGLESLNARAEIEGSFVAKLYDARSGATLWSSSNSDRRTLAALSVSGSGVSGASAHDPTETRSELVDLLVSRATNDFRPTWTRVKE